MKLANKKQLESPVIASKSQRVGRLGSWPFRKSRSWGGLVAMVDHPHGPLMSEFEFWNLGRRFRPPEIETKRLWVSIITNAFHLLNGVESLGCTFCASPLCTLYYLVSVSIFAMNFWPTDFYPISLHLFYYPFCRYYFSDFITVVSVYVVFYVPLLQN